MGVVVRLRPIERAELSQLLRLLWDPDASGDFEAFGFRMDRVSALERRWHEDRLISSESSYLAVDVDDTCAGWVNWRPVGSPMTFEIGIALFPDHRGHGIGTDAQRLLVDYLFDTTPARRLQAGTEVANLVEQKALEAVGFQREGVLRGAHFRGGQWRDSVVYGLLRDDRRQSHNSA